MAERRSNGAYLISGVQVELDAYFKGKNHYQNFNFAYSGAEIFQKIRAFYSYYQSYKNATEIEYGARYVKTVNTNIFGAVLGYTKYIGNYHINCRGFAQFGDGKLNPAIASNIRYYKTKSNY